MTAPLTDARMSVRAGKARTEWRTTENGIRIGTPAWCYPTTDLIAEWDLDTWDPDESPEDDQRRSNADLIAAAPADLADLLAEVQRLRGEAADFAIGLWWAIDNPEFRAESDGDYIETVERITAENERLRAELSALESAWRATGSAIGAHVSRGRHWMNRADDLAAILNPPEADNA